MFSRRHSRQLAVAIFSPLCLMAWYWNLFFVSISQPPGKGVVPPSHSSSLSASTKKLLFLHYHKTGHDLSRILAIMGFHVKIDTFKRSNSAKNVTDVLRASTSSNIIVASAVDMGTQWDGWLPQVKLVHFVRDPLDWVLSAYLYHIQEPFMERKWMTKKRQSTCRVTRPSHLLSQATLQQVATLCRQLTNTSLSFSSQLAALSELDGLRLEAARGLLGSDHGDLSLMVQHLEASRPYKGVLTFLLSDFTSSKSTFETSVRKLCLFGQEVLRNQTTHGCVKESVEYGWIDLTTANQSEHITSNRRSSVEKQQLKQSLLDDGVLGQPLRLLQQFVHQVYREKSFLLQPGASNFFGIHHVKKVERLTR